MNKNFHHPKTTESGPAKIYNCSTTKSSRIFKFVSRAVSASGIRTPIEIHVFGNRNYPGINGELSFSANKTRDILIHIGKRITDPAPRGLNKKIWFIILHEIGHELDRVWEKYGRKYENGYNYDYFKKNKMSQKEYNALPPERAANKFARKIIKKYPAPKL